MPAFVIGIPLEIAPDPMMNYRRHVEATVARFGGRYRTVRTYQVETLEGDWLPPHGLVILEFPTFEDAKAWYQSPEYAPLRAERMAGDRWNMIVVDGMQDGETLRTLGIAIDDDLEPMT